MANASRKCLCDARMSPIVRKNVIATNSSARLVAKSRGRRKSKARFFVHPSHMA